MEEDWFNGNGSKPLQESNRREEVIPQTMYI
jgi:hypothetical protein